MANIPRGHRMSPFDHSPEGVKFALDRSGLSQHELAEALGRSDSYISEIIGGTRNANPKMLLAMAKVLNCPVVVLEAKRAVSGAA